MVTASASQGGFHRWRRARPFWGGLLLLIAGIELFFSANLTLGDLEVHFGPEGFLSYLLPLLLILAGVLTWVSPAQRLFYGIIGLLTAVYSLVGLNLGGFGLGMLIGIVGGALVLAWAPTRVHPPAATPADAAATNATDQPETDPRAHDPAATMIVPGFSGGPDDHQTAQAHDSDVHGANVHGAEVHGSEFHRAEGRDSEGAGTGPAPLRPAQQADVTQQFPAQPAYPSQENPPGEDPRPPSNGVHRKAFVITLVPLAMTAAFLIAGSQTPARAEVECPAGLPSRPAAEAKKEASRQSSAKPSPSRDIAGRTPPKAAKRSASAPPSRSTTEKSTGDAGEDGDGNPIVDGWNGFVDGVGDLLGIGDDEKAEADPAPSTSAEAPPVPAPSGNPAPSGEVSSPAPSPSGQPGQSGSAGPSASSPASAAPSPTPSLSDIPCLGPRVFKTTTADDVPMVSVKGSVLEAGKLTMHKAAYDGVVQLNTPKGKLAALKFSMRQAVNEPFTLTVPETGDDTTLIKSKKLITDGNVRFYAPEFKGKLFGVIPVTFTPESPPPLMLPEIFFTDVRIKLAFVRCDKLTGVPLGITEKP